MKQVQRKYQVKAGDTTSAVAGKLGLPVAELVYYHNLHSKLVDEYIYGDVLPDKLKYILIPMNYEQEIPVSSKFEYSNGKVMKGIGKTIKNMVLPSAIFAIKK